MNQQCKPVEKGTRGIGFILPLILLLAGCSGSTKARSDAPADAKPVPKAHKTFKLDPKMTATLKIDVLKQEAMPSYLTASGKVQFNEDELANVIPPIPGQVQDLKIKVGDHVQKGDILFFIYSRDVAAALAEHQEAHKDLDLAQKAYARTKDLFEHEASSRMALDQSESELAKAQGRVHRTEESLRILGIADGDMHSTQPAKIAVRSSLTGTVVERKVTEGQFVQPDVNPLITIADLSTVWVLADVFEHDLRFVSTGNRAEVAADAYPDERFSARIARINDVIDPNTRAVKVRFLVSNSAQRLKPEMFAQARIVLQESQQGLSIPASAILTDGGKTYAFVAAGENEFEQREIVVTQDSGNRLRVVSGLDPGDRIVVDGVLLVHAEQAKGES